VILVAIHRTRGPTTQRSFTAQEAQPPALLVEWESPPGAKPLRFRLKAV